MSSSDRVILITTANAKGGRDEELRRLFASVAAFREARPHALVDHHLLLQCCNDPAASVDSIGVPGDVRVTSDTAQLPLSVARNRMLETVLAQEDLDDDLIGFPDDDAWYPAGTLEAVYDAFRDDRDLDLWFCRYGSAATWQPDAPWQMPSLQQVLSFASSNTVLLRGRILKSVRRFDETLGLGTPARSGEDTGFALRAFREARTARFVDARMIGHRDFDPSIRAKYYGGALLAIRRYGGSSPAGLWALGRKTLVGAALVARGELPVSEYRDALATTARG